MFNDLCHALRQLLKQPGFTAVAVLTLAIGIGATTAVYTVVQAVILDPIPSVKGDRLVAIQEFNRERQAETGLSATLLNELRGREDIFDRLCWYEVVGVVGDIRDSGFEHPPGPTYYEPESRGEVSFAFVMVRSSAPLESLAPTLRAALTGLATGIPTPTFHSMKERLWESSAARRTCLQLFGLFAVVGVMMAVVGIYGITAFSTAARTQELGIRMALGATRWKVVGLVLRQGLRLVVMGIGLALLAAHSLTRFLGSLLYDVSPTDPGVLLGMSVLFALVALTGCYLPARKASKINPIDALRYE